MKNGVLKLPFENTLFKKKEFYYLLKSNSTTRPPLIIQMGMSLKSLIFLEIWHPLVAWTGTNLELIGVSSYRTL